MTKKDIFCIVLTALLFATMEVVLKIAGGNLDAFQLTFIRFAIGGVVLLPFALKDLKKRQVKLTGGDWVYMTFLGIICIPVSMLLFQIAILNANASLVAVIICSNPIFVMIYSHFLLKDRMNSTKAFVLIISSTGLVFAANPFNMAEGNSAFGIICAILAAATFALYTTVGKLRIEKIGDMSMTCLTFILGCAVMLIPMLLMGKPIIAGINSSNILIVLYIGIAVTGIGYFAYFTAIHSCGPANASIVFFLKPIFAPIFAMFILSENITWNIILGIVLLLTGSFINIRAARKASIKKK